MNRIREVIESLPDQPKREIAWVCYNDHMIESARDMIVEIKGEEYLKNCRIISKETFDLPLNYAGDIYYSPGLYNYLGNGAN